jgi:pilus assembly protein CpaE
MLRDIGQMVINSVDEGGATTPDTGGDKRKSSLLGKFDLKKMLGPKAKAGATA